MAKHSKCSEFSSADGYYADAWCRTVFTLARAKQSSVVALIHTLLAQYYTILYLHTNTTNTLLESLFWTAVATHFPASIWVVLIWPLKLFSDFNLLESIAARCRRLLREFSSCAIFPIPTVVLHKRRGKGTVLANLCKPSPGSCRRGTLDPLEIFGCWCCLNIV